MVVTYESKDDTLWSYIFSFVYVSLATTGVLLLFYIPTNIGRISLIEILVLTLAIFRLIRLFTYDKIMQFLRDWFTDVSKEWDKKKQLYKVTREKPHSGFRRKLYELFGCPWCVGMWIAPIVLFTYIFFPILFPVYLFFAMAAVATFVQILMNLIGWKAELSKQKAQKK